MGKRRRRKTFNKPTPFTINNDKDIAKFQYYGIITKFHGNKHCDVTIYIKKNHTQHIPHVRLIGKIQPRKCRQTLATGNYIILTYSEISLVFSHEDAHKFIPTHILATLNNEEVEIFDEEEEDEVEAHEDHELTLNI